MIFILKEKNKRRQEGMCEKLLIGVRSMGEGWWERCLLHKKSMTSQKDLQLVPFCRLVPGTGPHYILSPRVSILFANILALSAKPSPVTVGYPFLYAYNLILNKNDILIAIYLD